MRKPVASLLRIALATAAIAVAAASMVDLTADASSPGSYPHSCYAGCCGTCQGGLCCFDEPLPPDPDRVPPPIIPLR